MRLTAGIEPSPADVPSREALRAQEPKPCALPQSLQNKKSLSQILKVPTLRLRSNQFLQRIL